jgi:hypothetical protein
MRVIHGVWARGALCLWGEDPARPPAPRGRAPAPTPHPFPCQAAELAALPGPAGDPVEELLAGLGAAARLFGELEDALREPAPVVVELDTPGASEGCLACW